MTKPPMIAMEFVAKAVQTAIRSGIDQNTILRMTGLKVEDIADRTKQLPLRQYIQLLESIAILIKDDYFGLHHGFTHHLSDFGVLGYIMLNSATVGCALNTLIQYFDVWQQATKVALTLDGDIAWLSYQICDVNIQTRKHDAEAAVAFGLNITCTLLRQPWCPQAVWLEHEPPAEISEHQRILRAPLFFNQPVNAIAMERKLLAQRVPLADQSLLSVLEHHLQTSLTRREANNELVSSVSQTIARSLDQRCPTLEEVASGLRISSRSLQRSLRDRHVTFKQLVDETRHRLSLSYLRDPDISLTEVALLLGYSEPSAFNHAFKRWTGLTPRQYRQHL